LEVPEKKTDEEMTELITGMVQSANITKQQNRDKLLEFMLEVRGMFMPTGGRVAKILKTRHRIVLHTDKPIASPPRRMSEEQRSQVRDTIQEMIEIGVIRPSKSPYASCTVLVRKPDGSWRCCIDFRRLNAVTKRDVTPLPRVDNLLQKLSPEKVFTGVDMWKGYWQVPLHDD
ncbi:unnamed protein product, partial [Heterosigma akashiwo]